MLSVQIVPENRCPYEGGRKPPQLTGCLGLCKQDDCYLDETTDSGRATVVDTTDTPVHRPFGANLCQPCHQTEHCVGDGPLGPMAEAGSTQIWEANLC